jgi:hypothetical protein
MAKQYMLMGDIPEQRDRLLHLTLQGIVNRAGPRLYLVADEDTDGHWVKWYRDYGLEPVETTLDAVLDAFLPETNGAYVLGQQDPDWEIPIAMTLAGLDDRVLVTPGQAKLVQAKGAPADPLPIPTFQTRLEAMAWAIGNLRPRTNPEVLHANFWPPHIDNIDIGDWIVATRGFSFRLTTNPVSKPGERELLGQLYDQSPLYTHVLGWHHKDDGECPHVHFATEHGMVPFCMTRNLNFSFHRHVAAKGEFKQKTPPAPPVFDPNRCYLTFVFSDGDAPHSMVDLQKRQWAKPERGQFPFGWAVPPQMLTFGPAMMEYFYHSMTANDELLCGPSGLGYNYLSRWAVHRPDVEDAHASRLEYLDRSNELMERLDLHAMWPINRILHWLPDGRIMRRIAGNDIWMVNADNEPYLYGVDFMDDGVIRDYCTRVTTSKGFFQGWHAIPKEKERVISGRPYFPGKVLAENPEQTIREIECCAAVEGSPCFIPVHVNCYAMELDGVAETFARIDGERFTTLLPTPFLELAVQRHGQAASP